MSEEARGMHAAGNHRAESARGLALWLLFAVVGLTVLAIAFVHAPGRIKLIGLYTMGYGAISGLLLAFLATKLHVRRSVVAVAATFVLIAAGNVGIAVESHRIWKGQTLEAFNKSPTGKLAAEVLSSPNAPSDLRDSLQEALDTQRRQSSFQHYLARRVSPLGDWPAPWPALVWILEVAVASSTGAWVFHRQTATRIIR